MYRKEECLSLFKYQEQHDVDSDNHNNLEEKPKLRWNKVHFDIVLGVY